MTSLFDLIEQSGIDRFDLMRLFVRVMERRSFTVAATDLGLPRSTATEAIKRLEARLGTRLLDRTTRVVTPTPDGQDYYGRCLAILADVEDAEGIFADTEPKGLLRIDAQRVLTQTFLLPQFNDFLHRYPHIILQIAQADRLVDLVSEGVNCVIRAGDLKGSGMIIRSLGVIHAATCASPEYLANHGTPGSPDDLDGHCMIGFVSSRTDRVLLLAFIVDGTPRNVALPSRVRVNNSETGVDLARLGLGLIQAPRYRFAQDFDAGTLVEILADFPPKPMPLSALYPQKRHVTARLRVFLDWVTDIFAKADL